MNPYEILGVAEGASLDEIKAAYLEKSRRYHPDAGGDAWAFRQIEWAYALLTSDATAGPHEERPEAANGSKADSYAPAAGNDDVDLRVVLGIILLAGLVWWFGWSGIFRFGLWLGLTASSGGAVYCACSAWAAGHNLDARRKHLLLTVILGGVASVTFALLALSILSTSQRPLGVSVRTFARLDVSPSCKRKGHNHAHVQPRIFLK
jgi:hypothetical protein